ncbi:MAG TPA: helix-hairpin-helix domain-containing protein [Conexibacter sp.]|nr:helix-hairpin-helix domain-containing protein [Conexibacter sp.]
MPVTPTKPQLAIYAAVVVAVLLIGSRFLREGAGAETASPAFAPVTTSAGSPDGLSAVAGDDAAGGAMNPDGVRLVVDVKGAVRRPGVYRLPADARTYDAVRRAGGLTRRADRVGVNLAARVVDGGEVVVPERGKAVATGAPATGGSASDGGAGADTPLSLDLNTATEQELEQLDGVGPATAANIVAYRQEHGGFASIDELDEVSGIGEAKLAAIRAQLGQ